MTETKALTRDELRAALVGKKQAPKRETITLFGCLVELQQPTLGSILEAQDEKDEKARVAEVFIKYAYVPGTDERIFEEGDISAILNWPFDSDLMVAQEAITRLTGINIGEAEEEVKTDPLSESS